jgi:selenoprotein W-related protein
MTYFVCWCLLSILQLTSPFPTKFLRHRVLAPNFQSMSMKPSVTIEYCTGCRWLLRSAWLAQELLTTFERDLGSVSLQPNSDSPGGVFIVRVDGVLIWDRKDDNTKGFPEAKILKQLVRDVINPELSLGHSETKVLEFPPT